MYTNSMLTIDGSIGEGGGQVLRSALTLSILTGTPIHLTNIRARRSKPGLQAQHLTAVKAAAAICAAETRGADLHATELEFHPGQVKPGRYRFTIETAGSACLVLQTVALPLALAPGTSTVTLRGGTHVPWSPSYHYLERQWQPHLQAMGLHINLTLNAAGFYPRGGGEVLASIRGAGSILPLERSQPGELIRIRGLSGVANLSLDIARRQKLQALRRLEPICRDSKIETLDLPSPVKGTFILLWAEFSNGQAACGALGAPGKRAERVADEAVDELLCISTARVTSHLLTNAQIIRQFLPARIEIEGEEGQPGKVWIAPR
jgi:RNA 3'-phosphate cyclase